ncbi:DUF1641 domain-containing protein [Bacillus subtilis]|uniref:DUF1641 domain-containing protein n=1 Tax=Bacillus subtilis TaxID=1423 RepID=UPI0015E786B5|nr:DUF1641 domain-containing protein [Bacillus subtilis]MEA1020849.1 DUF1641 domain-containing protein [Bacillus subtilis]MED3512522.1 DUF1641 domain-containing protein [Bacillus subtilis]MED3518952.1 DUF1641 domain-containing protein [Bacillus subtilis]
MAKAIKRIQKIEVTEEDQRKRDLREIEDALVDHKEAILETLHMLGHMNERGVLPLLRGLFGQGDKVLDILVKKADTEETANTLKNLLLLFGTLGMLDVKQLEPLILKVNAGVASAVEQKNSEEKTGYFDIIRSLKDPEINKSITLLFSFLKGMGQDTKELERTTQPPEHQKHHQEPREKREMNKRD